MATLGTQGTRQNKNNQKNTRKKPPKNTAQYVLKNTIRKQAQHTLISPPTNNLGTKEHSLMTNTTTRNSELKGN